MPVDGETASDLIVALEDAQRLGFLGPRPIAEVIHHARGFVGALAARRSIRTVLDLGSGGGIPGLVIAHDLPATRLTLIDRRSKRTDALERVVRRLGWDDRVSVVCHDVTTFQPAASFDAVVARGFGPPEFTLSAAARLVRAGGTVVISDPPGENRWDPRLLERLGLHQILPVPATDDLGVPSARSADHGASMAVDGLVAVFVKG